jgi:hypothetical protein
LQSAHFDDLGPEGVHSVSIKIAQSPTFDFAEGRSTFAAYKLPETRPHVVEVRTYANNLGMPYVTIFKPRILFLGADLYPIGANRLEPLQLHSGYFATSYHFARAQVPVNAKYMVIYAASSANSERLVGYSRNGTMYAVPNAYEGKISVTFP